MKQLFLMLILLALMVGGATGCRSTAETDGDAVDQLPWNTPASWEGQIIGVPY